MDSMITEAREVNVTVRIMAIRDGTHGISITMPDQLVGEWTDSGAASLAITEQYAASICGKDGAQRYMLTMPGTPVQGQQISDTEATIVVRL